MRCVAYIDTWSKRSDNASKKRYRSIQAAVSDILAHHPYGVARDGDRRPVDATTPDLRYAGKDGVLAVIWKNAADAVVWDLSLALAVIRLP